MLTQTQLFTAGQTSLNAAGTQLIAQLGSELAAQTIDQVGISTHDPASFGAGSNLLWLGRAAAIRTALHAYGPRAVSILTNSQTLSASGQGCQIVLDAAHAEHSALHISLLANQ